MGRIEQLKKETQKIENDLKSLKDNVSLSESEKKKQADAIKIKVEATKQKIENEIHSLENKTDDESKKKKEEAETLLNTFNETMSLYSSILNNGNTRVETTTEVSSSATATSTATAEEKQKEEKGFFGKIGEGLGNMRSDVTTWDKRKEQPGKNLLYTAGVGVTGYALYKGVKKLWNWAFGNEKKDKESDNESSSESSSKNGNSNKEKSFWDGTVGKTIKTVGSVLAVGSGVYYVAHGLYTKNRGLKDLWDWEKGKKIGFDTALDYCKGAISNQNNKEGMSYGLDLKYHEDTGEIEAYGERVKIDKEKRRIPGVGLGEVEFKKYEHMINAAILIAYLKKQYSGQCKNNSPFHLTGSWQGDINVNTSNGNEEAVDGTGNGGRIVGVTAGGIAGIVTGIFTGATPGATVGVVGGVVGYAAGSIYDHNNIMNDHMPELDDNFGKQSLQAYLNHMNCRQERNQTQEDITESPIKNEVRECVKKIQEENPDLPALGGRRAFDAIPDPEHPNRYTIKAYGREIYAEITDMDNVFTKNLPKMFRSKEMRILGISGGNPAIKTDMEQGKIADLKVPLQEGLYMSAILGKLLDNYHHKGNEYPRFEYTWKSLKLFTTGFGLWGDNNGMYFSDSGLDTMALSGDMFEKNMPTLFMEENRDRFLEFINKGITDEFNVPIRKKNE